MLSAGRVLSVNVCQPRLIEWKGESFYTSIFKTPVEGVVRVGAENLEGDRQSDLRVHGGRDKAVYVYSADHYEYWRRQKLGVELDWGVFGENLTVTGFLEHEVGVGDTILCGDAEFVVTQPRFPCFKLAARFGRESLIREFLQSGRSGFYLRIVKQGQLRAGDEFRLIKTAVGSSPTIADLVDVRRKREA